MAPFSPASYELNALSAAICAVGLIMVGLGLWVWSRDRRDPEHSGYGVMAVLFALSIIPTGISISALDPELAKFLDRLGWAPMCMVPPAILSFVGSHLEIAAWKRRLPFFYAASALFIPLTYTRFFIDAGRVKTYAWGEVAQMSWVGYVFLAVFTATLTIAFRAHWKRWHAANIPARKRKMYGVTFVAMCFGVLASLDFLGYLGVPWPPLSFAFLTIWMGMYAYAILKLKLFRLTNSFVAPSLLDSMPGAIFVTNTEGEILIANPYASQLTLVSEAETRGRHIGDFLPAASDALNDVAGLRPVGPILWERETSLKDAADRERPVSVSAMTVRNERGDVQGYTFIAVNIEKLRAQMDIIERQKAELEKAMSDMRTAQERLVQREIRMIEIKKDIDRLKKAS